MSFPRPASHPKTCAACHGTGYETGLPAYETVGGVPHEYTTVVPCTHHWTDDDPDA